MENQQAASSWSAAALARYIERERAFSGAMQKLFLEAIQLGGTRITIELTKKETQITVFGPKGLLTSTAAALESYRSMTKWLLERSTPAASGGTLTAPGQGLSGGDTRELQLALPDQVMTCTISENSRLDGHRVLSCAAFAVTSISQAIAAWDLTAEGRTVMNELLSAPHGIVLLGGPTPQITAVNLSMWRGVRDAVVLPRLTAVGLAAALRELDTLGSVVIVPCEGSDPVEMLLFAQSCGLDLGVTKLLAVAAQGFVRALCRACAREGSVDRNLLSLLPAGLRPGPEQRFLIGRGCPQCHQTGYQGMVGVQALCSGASRVVSELRRGAAPARLSEMLFAEGVRPLLADGMTKVQKGSITLGSLFEISRSVPAAYERFFASAAQRPPQNEAALVPQARSLTSKASVLVVEDDEDQRQILELVFREAGYEVCGAHDGAEALETLVRFNPDVIITDLMMPRIDGHELVRQVRRSGDRSRIPILVLTVLADQEKELHLLELGADDYCEKTIQKNLLLKRVERLLHNSSAKRQP